MRKLLLLLVVCIFQFGLGQSKKNQETDIVSHQVKMGETVRMLSKKYLVDPTEIYKLNKFAVEGISEGMVLQIPVPRKEAVVQQEEEFAENSSQNTSESIVPTEEQPVAIENEKPKKEKTIVKETPVEVSKTATEVEHIVVSGETLYSLSRQYHVSVDAIRIANDNSLKKGLKVGQMVRIPSSTDNVNEIYPASIAPDQQTAPVQTATKENAVPGSEQSSQGNPITHTVAPKETLYSLSKKYGVTIDDIKAQNPDVEIRGLQIGQRLTITKN